MTENISKKRKREDTTQIKAKKPRTGWKAVDCGSAPTAMKFHPSEHLFAASFHDGSIRL